MKRKMKKNFDSRHRAQTLPELNTGDTVWLPNEQTEASVLEKIGPRSYNIATSNGTLQRNRCQIRPMPHQEDNPQTDTSTNANETENGGSETNLNEVNGENPNTFKPIASAEPYDRNVRTSSGRISRPPKRYGEEH